MAKRWGNNGNSERFFFGVGGPPKSLQMVTAAMKLKHLLLGGKAMTNLNGILKTTDITLPTKIHIVKAMVFPVVMYGCESGAERQRHYFANKACSSQSYS